MRFREGIGVIAAVVIGPAFAIVGNAWPELIFGNSSRGAAIAALAVCIVVIPLLALFADRAKFLAWQIAVLSLTVSTAVNNVRMYSEPGSQIIKESYLVWAMCTLASSPLLIYFMLRPLRSSHRYVAGAAIVVVAAAMWLGVKTITG